ncbi:MAG: hypothetical protein IJP31_06000 [Lachnospiraceae bacterium]|nr:hypothetical protein [Lachnospiraceae bacterium]
MEQVKKILEARENYLLQIKREKEKAVGEAPDGTIRICSREGRTQYYLRKNPKDSNGVYLQKDKLKLVQQLVQKEYDKKVIYTIEQELNAIKKYLLKYPHVNAEQIYMMLHKERQKLIVPIRESEEDFIARWEAVEFQGKYMDEEAPEFYTQKGERVRSKSEVIIADILNKEKIPYRYECPINLTGLGKIYPDFTVLNRRLRKEWYWEHLGMMDDPAYAERAVQKIISYEQNGIFPGESLILTYETRKVPLNQKLIQLLIQKYLV